MHWQSSQSPSLLHRSADDKCMWWSACQDNSVLSAVAVGTRVVGRSARTRMMRAALAILADIPNMSERLCHGMSSKLTSQGTFDPTRERFLCPAVEEFLALF